MLTADERYARIITDGGATWNGAEDTGPSYGYLVSVAHYEYKISVYEFAPDVIEYYEDSTKLPEGAYYGAWVDGDYVYLDVSLHVTTEAEALLIADIEDQLAVFDAYAGEVVTCRERVER